MMINYQDLDIQPRWWKFGLPRLDLWAKNADLISKFIAEYKLKPEVTEHLQGLIFDGSEMETPVVARSSKATIKIRPFPGGLRIPHLHFKGELYVVNEAQWSKISSQLMDGFRAKLAASKSVSFEQVMELSEAINSL